MSIAFLSMLLMPAIDHQGQMPFARSATFCGSTASATVCVPSVATTLPRLVGSCELASRKVSALAIELSNKNKLAALLLACFCYSTQLLTRLWHFAHRAQAACADIHIAQCTIDLETTALHIKYEATACTML